MTGGLAAPQWPAPPASMAPAPRRGASPALIFGGIAIVLVLMAVVGMLVIRAAAGSGVEAPDPDPDPVTPSGE